MGGGKKGACYEPEVEEDNEETRSSPTSAYVLGSCRELLMGQMHSRTAFVATCSVIVPYIRTLIHSKWCCTWLSQCFAEVEVEDNAQK